METNEIENLSSSQILNPDILNQIEELSKDGMYEAEPKEAQEFFYILHDTLNKYKDDLSSQPQIQAQYQKILTSLFWQGIQAIDDSLKRFYITNYLVAALKEGIDVTKGLQRYLNLFEHDFVPSTELRSNLLYEVTSNQERIGQEMIELKTKDKVASTIENWIRDYISYLPANAAMAGGFDKVSYLTNSVNASKLSPEDKGLLSKVIDVYSFLKNPKIVNWRTVAPKIPSPTAAPKLSAPIPLAKPLTPSSDFNSKLSAAGTGPGASLDLLKSRLQKKEPSLPTPSGVRMTPEEIEREVGMEELPASPSATQGGLAPKREEAPPAPRPPLVHKEDVIPKPLVAKVQTINFAPKSQVLSAAIPPMASRMETRPAVASVPKASYPIRLIDDLKKLDIAYLRAGALQTQISNLQSTISNLAQSNNVLPYHVVLAYEQSPLFRAYLKAGTAKLTNIASPDELTQIEFEALADLRRQVEHL